MQNGQQKKRRAAHYFTFFDGGRHSTDTEAHMWENILPTQFYSPPGNNQQERGLFLAILESALHDFQNGFFFNGTKMRRFAREAENWFASKDDSFPVTFERVCQVLDLNPDYLRKGLWKMKDVLLEKQAQGTLTKKDRNK